MDLESECSVPDSVEVELGDNEVNSGNGCLADDHKIEHSGSCSNEIDELRTGEGLDVSASSPADREGNSVENLLPGNLTSLACQSSGEGDVLLKKGAGLRKWRRIRRDVVKDSGSSLDSGKVLKRGLSEPHNPAKPLQNSEGSVGSINMAKHRSFVDGFAVRGSGSDSRFAAGPAFAAGTDSDNSEDRSSKSSTAASVPKVTYDLPVVSGYARGRNKVKNLSGKNLGSSSQRVQLGKGHSESSKKHRVKIEKENSYSSVESDSRSTDFVFRQGTPTSNGKLSRTTITYEGENSDEAHASDQEEMQAGYSKGNVEEVEDISPDDSAAELSWEAKEEKSENHKSSTDRDPILTLLSVQEALEQELKKYEEIAKEYALPGDNNTEGSRYLSCTDPEILESCSSDQTGYGKTPQASSSSKTQVLKLSQNVKLLESELEEVRAMLQEKDSIVAELETALNSGQEKYKEMETQIDSLLKEKMEAEIKSMVMAMETRKYRVPAADQITLLEEQKALAEHQTEVMHKLEETEKKAETIKKQAEDLDKCCGDLLGIEEIIHMKKRVCGVTSCFFVQAILLFFFLWLFVSQFSPHPGVIVPT